MTIGSQLLVLLWRSCLGRRDESSANPDPLSSIHEGSGKPTTIIDTTGSYDWDLRICRSDNAQRVA